VMASSFFSIPPRISVGILERIMKGKIDSLYGVGTKY
jgi:hypothetical protein